MGASVFAACFKHNSSVRLSFCGISYVTLYVNSDCCTRTRSPFPLRWYDIPPSPYFSQPLCGSKNVSSMPVQHDLPQRLKLINVLRIPFKKSKTFCRMTGPQVPTSPQRRRSVARQPRRRRCRPLLARRVLEPRNRLP